MARPAKDLFHDSLQVAPGGAAKRGVIMDNGGLLPARVWPDITSRQASAEQTAFTPRLGQGHGQLYYADPPHLLRGKPISYDGTFYRSPTGGENAWSPWPEVHVDGNLSAFTVQSFANVFGPVVCKFIASNSTDTTCHTELRMESFVNAPGLTITDPSTLFTGNTSRGDRPGDDVYWGLRMYVPIGFATSSWAIFFQSEALYNPQAVGYKAFWAQVNGSDLSVSVGMNSGVTALGGAPPFNLDINMVPGWTVPLGQWVDYLWHIKWATDYTGALECWVRPEGEDWITGFSSKAFFGQQYPAGIPTMITDGTEEANTRQVQKVATGMYRSVVGGSVPYWYMNGWVRAHSFDAASEHLLGNTVEEDFYFARPYDREVMHLGDTDPNERESITGFKNVNVPLLWQARTLTGPSTYAMETHGVYEFPITYVDTTAATVSVTLPTFPYVGEWYRFIDYKGTWAGSAFTLSTGGVNTFQNGTSTSETFAVNGGVVEVQWTGNTWAFVTVPVPTTSVNPSAPLAIGGITLLMEGLGASATIKPRKNGRCMFTVTGCIRNTVAANGGKAVMKIGTGAAPLNNGTLAGTTVGNFAIVTTFPVASARLPFSVSGISGGLSIGATYWIDLAVSEVATGTGAVSVDNISMQAYEL